MKVCWKATFRGMSQLELAFLVPTCAKIIEVKHFGGLGSPSIESQMSNGNLVFCQLGL